MLPYLTALFVIFR